MLLSEILRVLFGLIAVLGMIGIAAYAARRLNLISSAQGLARRKRLSVVETLAIDTRRRLIIVRCDDKEHLLVLGQSGETLIESALSGPEESEAPDQQTTPVNPFVSLRDFTKNVRNLGKDAA